LIDCLMHANISTGGETSKSSVDFVQDEQSWAGTYSTDALHTYVLIKYCQKKLSYKHIYAHLYVYIKFV
jgi:hypothetical protein